MELVEFGRLTPALRAEVEGDEDDPFDAACVALHFRAKEHHVGLRDERGRLVASTGMVTVDVDVDSRRFPVVGLGASSSTRVTAAGDSAAPSCKQPWRGHRPSVPAFAILFCHENRAGLY